MVSALDLGSASHVAVVVDDLDEGMRVHSEALGVSWARPWTGPITIEVDGELTAPIISFTYSRGPSPHLELIEAVSGTVWMPGTGLHHVGYWVEDVDSDRRRLEEAGFRTEVRGPDGDFAYLRPGTGLRIELADAESRPRFERWAAGGDL